jgi:hypothetical protein
MFKIYVLDRSKKSYYISQIMLTLIIGFPAMFYYWNEWELQNISLQLNLITFILHCMLNVMFGFNCLRCFFPPKNSFDLEIQKWCVILYAIPASIKIYLINENFYPSIHSLCLFLFILFHIKRHFKPY